jgi:2-polyprenyl-6-hydroxyphenyl methylase/3-demethylubiquinone-9 3-methyltransferase
MNGFGIKDTAPRSAPCKICGDAAPLFGVVDFAKSCEDVNGRVLPLSGVPIYYRHCRNCGFLFTDAFDAWSAADFARAIYNDEYIRVDPDWIEKRPVANARLLASAFAAYKSGLTVLDYGGGNGRLTECLRSDGFLAADTYDPFIPRYAELPDRRFSIVTCFETLEHLPNPMSGIEAMTRAVAEEGMVLFSTLVQPDDIERTGLSWWYAAPRNGHISLFSRKALAVAWSRFGFTTGSFNDNLHVAFRRMPAFARHLLAA